MTSKLDHLQDANFPRDPEGRVYHLGVKRGEVANRILSVGDATRAKMIASMLDNPTNPAKLLIVSNRGFTVYTGTYKSVPVTVIATGMGVAMIDFLVRECRAVIDGTMVVIRYGTCGTPHPDVKVGSVIISDSSVLVRRNPDHWAPVPAGATPPLPYDISLPVPSDIELTELLKSKILEGVAVDAEQRVRATTVLTGANVTGDSFYSSQGRWDPGFTDENTGLVDLLMERYPHLRSLEMETFQLLHLARCCKKQDMRASAAVMVLAQRRSNEFLDNDHKHALERMGGHACLETLINLAVPDAMNDEQCVWNKLE